VVWGLATFHTVAFVLLLLVLLYAGGSLGSLLQGLNTELGFGLFGALWATNWLCTRRALRGLGALRPVAEGWPKGLRRLRWLGSVSGQGVVWGGVNGVLFLLCLLGVAIASFVVSLPFAGLDAARGVPAAVAGFGIFLAFGAVAAFIVGACVGAVFSVVDGALLALADRAVRCRSVVPPVPRPL
jgi:hypothetical protein